MTKPSPKIWCGGVRFTSPRRLGFHPSIGYPYLNDISYGYNMWALAGVWGYSLSYPNGVRQAQVPLPGQQLIVTECFNNAAGADWQAIGGWYQAYCGNGLSPA